MPLGHKSIHGLPLGEIGKPKMMDVKPVEGFSERFFAKYRVSSTSLVLWLDQGDPQSGVLVGTWDDLSGREVSGQDNDIVQTSATNQPTVTATYPGYRTFNGDDNYMRQKVYDTDQGTVTYNGNNLDDDAGQDFNEWKTTTGNAVYMVVVVDDDSHVSWGYLGDVVDATEIKVYDDIGLTSAGWNGDGGTGTPASYEIRKTDFQITGDITVLAWVKNPDKTDMLLTMWDDGAVDRSILFWFDGNGYAAFSITSDGSTEKTAVDNVDISDDAWHLVAGTFTASTNVKVYVDGILEDTNTTTIPATIHDSFQLFAIGAYKIYETPGLFWNGEIASVMVFSRALSADEILRIYQTDYPRFK